MKFVLGRTGKGYCLVAVDIWILEVKDPSRAVRGLSASFGLSDDQSQNIVSSLPYCVKRDVREQDAPRYEAKLKSIGASVTWGPAGGSSPPAPRVVVPPNDPPEEPIEVPVVPPTFDAGKARIYWGLLAVGVLGVIILAVAAPGLSSGEAGWPTATAGGVILTLLAGGVFGSVLTAFRLSIASPILPLVAGALAAGVCALVLVSSEPDPQERISHVATLRAEVLGGLAPEARVFLDGNGTFETADASSSRALVESLYNSGARRVLAIDEDDDGQAEWVAIDMPVLPARRSAISGAVRSYAGADFNQIPGELATPSVARHWIVPVNIH